MITWLRESITFTAGRAVATAFILLCLAPGSISQNKADSLLSALEKASTRERPKILHETARHFYLQDSIALAYNYAMQTIEESGEGNQAEVCGANHVLGYIYLFWDDYQAAIDAFQKSYRIAVEMKDEKSESVSLHGMSRAYSEVGNIEEAIAATEEGMAIAGKLGNKLHLAGLYSSYGTIYNKKGEYEKAYEALQQYERLALELGDKRSLVYALNNQAEQLILLNRDKEALELLGRAKAINDSISDIQATAAILGNIGHVYQKMGRYPEAIDYHNGSLDVSLKAGIRRFSIDSYKYLSESYAALGDYDKALEMYKLSAAMSDSLLNETKHRQINNLIIKHRLAEERQHIKLLEQKSENQRLGILLLILGSVMILSILVFVVIGYRYRLRINEKERTRMSTLIEEQHRELASALMQSSQIRELLGYIEKSIRQMDNNNDPNAHLLKGELNLLKERVKMSIGSSDEWNSIKMHFDKVHPDFFRNLHNRHPELTRYDLKQCAYIKMDLGTKDIARILNVSDRAIQTARYRIKKKMNLDPDTDLIRHIQEI